MAADALRTRSRGRSIVRALAMFVLVLCLLYAWDGSRQPVSGSGWRLLIARPGLGAPGAISVISDQSALAAAWDDLLLNMPVPPVDFEREFVAWFVDAGTYACRSRLDGFEFDPTTGAVTARFGRGLVLFCDEQAEVPESFLIAIDRKRLPAAPFRLLLDGRRTPGEPAPSLEVTALP